MGPEIKDRANRGAFRGSLFRGEAETLQLIHYHVPSFECTPLKFGHVQLINKSSNRCYETLNNFDDSVVSTT